MIEVIRNIRAASRLRRALAPRRGFRLELWRRLETELSAASSPARFASRLAWAAAVSFSVLLAFGGTGAYAYSSADVVPDNPLYGVKIGLEQAEAAVAVTPGAKAAARARRIGHRLAEADKLSGQGAKLESVLDDLDRELSGNADVDEKTAGKQELLAAMAKVDDEALDQLQTIAAKNPAKALPKIQRVIVQNARRIEDRLPKVQDGAIRDFLAHRLERRRDALGGIIAGLEAKEAADPAVGAASGTPGGALKIQRRLDKLEGELKSIQETLPPKQ
jgi:hypothetical protein